MGAVFLSSVIPDYKKRLMIVDFKRIVDYIYIYIYSICSIIEFIIVTANKVNAFYYFSTHDMQFNVFKKLLSLAEVIPVAPHLCLIK